ncbi:hypothetical protein CWO84_15425 [Methylomonas sp. Kb3]|nr:hypothetical protein CWO84_15425 [Methylomonas sp. Kb3]
MEKKEVMRKNGIKSPDIFDAKSFAWLEDAVYMVSDNAGSGVTSAVESAKAAVEDMFSDVE